MIQSSPILENALNGAIIGASNHNRVANRTSPPPLPPQALLGSQALGPQESGPTPVGDLSFHIRVSERLNSPGQKINRIGSATRMRIHR